MWCSSNSITDDSICLRLFQRTLTGEASKWYVDQASSSHTTFATLARSFLSYFQLPLRYDTGIELLTSFHQSSATHLSDHAREWRRRKSLCQSPTFEDRVYMDWFLRSLLPPIEKDVASHLPQTEEAALQLALKYDLIYAQTDIFIPFYLISPDPMVSTHRGHLMPPTVSLELSLIHMPNL